MSEGGSGIGADRAGSEAGVLGRLELCGRLGRSELGGSLMLAEDGVGSRRLAAAAAPAAGGEEPEVC